MKTETHTYSVAGLVLIPGDFKQTLEPALNHVFPIKSSTDHLVYLLKMQLI